MLALGPRLAGHGRDADLGLELVELVDQGVVEVLLRVVLRLPDALVVGQAVGPLADRVDGLLGAAALQGQAGGGLGAVEQDQAALGAWDEAVGEDLRPRCASANFSCRNMLPLVSSMTMAVKGVISLMKLVSVCSLPLS